MNVSYISYKIKSLPLSSDTTNTASSVTQQSVQNTSHLASITSKLRSYSQLSSCGFCQEFERKYKKYIAILGVNIAVSLDELKQDLRCLYSRGSISNTYLIPRLIKWVFSSIKQFLVQGHSNTNVLSATYLHCLKYLFAVIGIRRVLI